MSYVLVSIIIIYFRKHAREEAQKNGEDPEEAAAAVDAGLPEDEEPTEVKYAVRSGPYELCRKAGLGELAHSSVLIALNIIAL